MIKSNILCMSEKMISITSHNKDTTSTRENIFSSEHLFQILGRCKNYLAVKFFFLTYCRFQILIEGESFRVQNVHLKCVLHCQT